MKRFSMFKRFAFALGCAVLCLNSPVRADEQVPFKGNFDTTVLSVVPVDPTHVRVDLQVNARATLLGNAQGPAYFILDVTTFSYVGEATWAAANGDAVSTTFAGQLIPTATPGVLDNVETIEIVGGTGRFEGATGACVAAGHVDAATLLPLAPAPFVGTISSPGSLKK
jgi:hypothetical protein